MWAMKVIYITANYVQIPKECGDIRTATAIRIKMVERVLADITLAPASLLVPLTRLKGAPPYDASKYQSSLSPDRSQILLYSFGQINHLLVLRLCERAGCRAACLTNPR
jgi:hypothetical protein